MTRVGVMQGVRMAQVALVAGALFTGLAWYDSSDAVETLGSERLDLEVHAPITRAHGPWPVDAVFTERDAGIPIDLAPSWNVTFTYSADRVQATDHEWRAELTTVKVAGDGRPWYRITESVPVISDGGRAWVLLDAAAAIERARGVDEEAGVPGRLDLMLTVQHVATLDVAGSQRLSLRTATLALVPNDGHVVVAATGDDATYSRVVPKGVSWAPIVLAASVVLLEGSARVYRRTAPPWERSRARWVPVSDLEIIVGTPFCDVDAALALAEEANATVLVDVRRQILLVTGATPVAASLAGPPLAQARGAPLGPRGRRKHASWRSRSASDRLR